MGDKWPRAHALLRVHAVGRAGAPHPEMLLVQPLGMVLPQHGVCCHQSMSWLSCSSALLRRQSTRRRNVNAQGGRRALVTGAEHPSSRELVLGLIQAGNHERLPARHSLTREGSQKSPPATSPSPYQRAVNLWHRSRSRHLQLQVQGACLRPCVLRHERPARC